MMKKINPFLLDKKTSANRASLVCAESAASINLRPKLFANLILSEQPAHLNCRVIRFGCKPQLQLAMVPCAHARANARLTAADDKANT